MSQDKIQSAFSRNRVLASYIEEGVTSSKVLDLLIPNGKPLMYEKVTWDYKLKLPTLPNNGVRLSRQAKDDHAVAVAEIVKDAVAFHNSYGGYLVIGVSDKERKTIGFDELFDCDGLNQAIKAATGRAIDCVYENVRCNYTSIPFGLLFIPRRSDAPNETPVQFVKSSPKSRAGKYSFRKGDIYIRDSHNSRPAESAEDFMLLCSQGRRAAASPKIVQLNSLLEYNLPPEDPGFIELIGREKDFAQLWRWLNDPHRPMQVLAGLGGVGKTTIAREFAIQVVKSSPLGFEQLIWLSAKPRFFAALQGRYVEASRVDFTDAFSMFVALLTDLACEGDIEEDSTIEELTEVAANALRIIPTLIVIDDLDSLPDTEQRTAYHQLLNMINRSTGNTRIQSKLILTTRLDLGAAPNQLIRVRGLPRHDFRSFVYMSCDYLGLDPKSIFSKSRNLEELRKITDGSPMFASSILRSVNLGEKLPHALNHWKGGDGQEARSFAFEREIDTLTESQMRTLYALCVLGESSASELRQIVDSNLTCFQDDIGELSKFHMVASNTDGSSGGPQLSVPSSIRLMSTILKNKIHDPTRIEKNCARARKSGGIARDNSGETIRRVIALWKDSQFREALDTAKIASDKNRNNPDLRCLLGRAYLRIQPPDASTADAEFRKAFELGCERQELIELWIEAKLELHDWTGLLEVAERAEKQKHSSENIYYMAQAYLELGSLAETSADWQSAARHYLQAGNLIENEFKRNRIRGRVNELIQIKESAMESYVSMIDRDTPDKDEYINKWIAVVRAYDNSVKKSYLVRQGISSLSEWWRAVERRDKKSENTLNTMYKQLNTLYRIEIDYAEHPSTPPEFLQFITESKHELDQRVDAYNEEMFAPSER